MDTKIESANTTLREILDAISSFTLTIDTKLMAIQEKIVIFETGYKFQTARIDDQGGRLDILEAKIHAMEIENVRLMNLEKDVRHQDIKLDTLINEMGAAKKEYLKDMRSIHEAVSVFKTNKEAQKNRNTMIDSIVKGIFVAVATVLILKTMENMG